MKLGIGELERLGVGRHGGAGELGGSCGELGVAGEEGPQGRPSSERCLGGLKGQMAHNDHGGPERAREFGELRAASWGAGKLDVG